MLSIPGFGVKLRNHVILQERKNILIHRTSEVNITFGSRNDFICAPFWLFGFTLVTYYTFLKLSVVKHTRTEKGAQGWLK
jgi:hypothetical protein